MIDYEKRLAQAKAYSAWGEENVKNGTFKTKQKYPKGARVQTTHTWAGCTTGTIIGTYAQLYGGDNIDSYSLDIDGRGKCSWFPEASLTLIETEDINLNYSPLKMKTSITVTKNGEEVEQSEFSSTEEAVNRFYELAREAKEQDLKRKEVEAFNSLENIIELPGLKRKDINDALDNLTIRGDEGK